MRTEDRPTFTVVTPADADARRFIDLATIRSLTGIASETMDDTALGLLLDGVLAACARSCRLAKAAASPATLAREVVRASWPDSSANVNRRGIDVSCGRYHSLVLPWRSPITSIEVAEGETELVEGTDFRLLPGGVVERIGGGAWSLGAIDVTYTAGWLADDEDNPVPADLVALIADQVRLGYSQRSQDFSLRSEDVPGVWSGTYNVPGGAAIDTSGLMRPLYDALSPFRAPPSFA